MMSNIPSFTFFFNVLFIKDGAVELSVFDGFAGLRCPNTVHIFLIIISF